MGSLDQAHASLQQFKGVSLRQRVAQLEHDLQGLNRSECSTMFLDQGISTELLIASIIIKRASNQINEVIHTLGIMLSLPYILKDNEIVQYVSLAAGNTGRSFDLETSHRIAEFKFIDWRGGPEAIRQNQFFKDFYLLAEMETSKEKYLYSLGIDIPLKFLNGKRALGSVMSKDNRIWTDFQQRHNTRFTRVYEYYNHQKDNVKLRDLNTIVPFFSQEIASDFDESA